MGRKDWIDVMRSAGLPYPVSQPSLALAEKAVLRDDVPSEYIDRVARERSELKELLTSLGWRPEESQGNFVFARGGNSLWLRDAMAAMGDRHSRLARLPHTRGMCTHHLPRQ